MKVNKTLAYIANKEQSGMGGLFFLITTFLCAVILLITIGFSWLSTVQSTSNNIAFVVSMATTTYNYNTNQDSYHNTTGIVKKNGRGETYNVMTAYNAYITEMGIAASGVEWVDITWDKPTKTTTVKFGPFKANWFNFTVQPDPQATNIE